MREDSMKRVKRLQKEPVVPRITFVGGKWYNQLGQEVPKPQPATGQVIVTAVQATQEQGQLQRYDHDQLLERLVGCTCTRPHLTGHVPGCVHFADALYVCERANREHITALAKLAQTTIADLERRRIDFAAPAPDNTTNGPWAICPEPIPQTDGRRRCIRCPYWTRHPDETPFDHQAL
jgi:hypothetical protein